MNETRDRVESYLARQSAARTLAQVARGAEVSRPTARKYIAELGSQGRIVVGGLPGSPTYRLTGDAPEGWQRFATDDMARLDAILDQWVARWQDRAATEDELSATVFIAFEFSTRLPEATAGLLALAIRRLGERSSDGDG